MMFARHILERTGKRSGKSGNELEKCRTAPGISASNFHNVRLNRTERLNLVVRINLVGRTLSATGAAPGFGARWRRKDQTEIDQLPDSNGTHDLVIDRYVFPNPYLPCLFPVVHPDGFVQTRGRLFIL